jgi:fructose-1-phosphate kinase PfkB-like protein
VTPPRTPLFTLTGNLLWERTLVFGVWEPGRTQRASVETFQVGGKGINVSRMLHRLGYPTRALGFAGGATGSDCEAWLARHGVDFVSFPADQDTRIGVVVRGGGRPETTFLGPDVPPGPAGLRACADFLDAQPGGCTLAVCGSLPGWAGPDFDPLRAALDRWFQRGSVAVDTYGPPLDWLAGRPASIVKVNRAEFDGLFPPDGPGDDVPARLIRLRKSRPAGAWVVTDGPNPVWFVDGRGECSSLVPPAVRETSPTGAGDVLLSCVLYAQLELRYSLRDAVAFALPYAAAKASEKG